MGRGEQELDRGEEGVGEMKVEEGKQLLTAEEGGGGKVKGGPPPPPDGGWGWVIVAASFLCNMVLDGIGYSFGILLEPLMEHYKKGKGEIAMVGSILAGFIMLVGPISSTLVNKFGPRLTCILGALVSGLSIFVSTFSPNVYMLMISYGVLGGFGLGLMYVPAVTAVGFWFEKRRSLVTGISTCGSGFGTIVMAPLVTVLEGALKWQWCNRIIALFCISCTLLGATMKPVPTKDTSDDEDSIAEIKKQNPILKEKAFNASREEIDYMDGEMNESGTVMVKEKSEKDNEVEGSEVKPKNGYLRVLSNFPFLLVMLGNLPAVMGLYIPYSFLPAMAKQRGLAKSQSALLISIIGFFNTGGRIVSGAVTDHPKVDALFVTVVALGLGAVCPILMTFCTSFWSFCLACILFGLSLSAWPAVTSSLLVELLGLELLTSAFGVLTCIRGASAFLGPPLGGFVIDATSPAKNVTVLDDIVATTVGPDFTTMVPDLSSGMNTTMATSMIDEVDTANYSVAFVISSVLLGLASLGHLVAYFVKKAQDKRRKSPSADVKA